MAGHGISVAGFQFLSVRLRLQGSTPLGSPSVVSIPLGSIKTESEDGFQQLINNVSIPLGSIKTQTLNAKSKTGTSVSIPLGSIKTRPKLTLVAVYLLFQFLSVRLRLHKLVRVYFLHTVSIPLGSIKTRIWNLFSVR